MKSTDYNLNDPFVIDSINLQRTLDSRHYPNIEHVNQNFYDLIQIKDPNTVYVINDATDGRIYYGDILIPKERNDVSYLIGNDKKGNYVLYMNRVVGFNDKLIEICKYKDPQDAINNLNLFNNSGSHQPMNLKIYTTIISYLNDNISINDMILGIIVIFGFKNDPRLQYLIETSRRYIMEVNGKIDKDLPPLWREELRHFKDRYPDSLFIYYSDLYDIIVKYNFFKDDKYNLNVNEHPDLSDVINEIINMFIKYNV